MSLEDSRREYQYGRLRRESLKESPFEQFNLWMEQAIHSDLSDPTAMCLATVNAEGKPWQRTVLLKGMDERGLMFYTNLGSRKAREMSGNPNVSLIFPWMRMDRQVIVGGQVERLTKTEVLSYFLKRPRGSQLAAWASQQSSRLSSRQALEAQFIQMKEKFAAGEIPVPDFWGGYRVVPGEFEFWQGGENRLHDRFQYLRAENGWAILRLAP
ncbi:pyridoxamine 5'-phosphate oxidase [Porticoccus hydrocarbonoclasticus]|jgi:pyridoxamine 5'-phosphate oxidase|uniref:pyridoxamine 5'-phosphate oxidase n=1 Tax=Porticoccus hydrocarbonoclasticus TaxID=1073414 RepID=UPI0005659BD5|nr:pyridoxamine 5'-phosphate oxidase [Porticoccus hydrocarbonoclasticus]|tara:strand:- start:457 stop:1092 length:636 start_codon:yes stop_codon:yes gene_type:complete